MLRTADSTESVESMSVAQAARREAPRRQVSNFIRVDSFVRGVKPSSVNDRHENSATSRNN